jgi:glycosyltransferase involved in cell wall biosynthesis
MAPALRVLQIVPSISLVYGGPSQMVLGLSQALAKQNVDVTILTTDSNGDAGQAPLEVPLDRSVDQDGYQIRYFRCAPFRRYKFSLGLLRWLSAHAHEFDLAHIHALFSPVSSFAAAIARAQRLPYLLRPLGTLDPADLRKKYRLKQIYATLLERPNLAGATAIHFTSDQEAKISERFGLTTRDLVIPLGVTLPVATDNAPTGEASLAQFNLPETRPRLLFMSRIDPKKGLDLLIPALERLLSEGIAFHWILAGANPQDPGYEETIKAQIQASPLSSHTTIAGFVSGDLKLALLQTTDLFVLPSYYENFGIAVAEAMAAGLAVVISDQVHIYTDIQRAEAGWIAQCTVESLTNALRAALQSASERQRRGEAGKAFAQRHYSWEAIAQQTLQAYQHLLNRYS